MSTTRAALPRDARLARGRGPADDERLATLASALGHPVRVAIVRLLSERGDCVCGSIVEQFPLAQSTVSQHLKVLKQAGFVEGEVDGPRVCYCVNREMVERFKTLVGAL
jgi:ArsR family transcriptional regulator